jgi:1-deoxy-D-xylulose-5-phosphate synthase
LFRSFGFKYYGPIDGHDVDGLRKTLEDLKNVKGPKLLHVVTVKGKGFAPAEREQTKWHAQSSPFDKITGKSLATPPVKVKAPKYQDVFGEALVQLAQKNEQIVSMTPAMPSGSSLLPMMQAFPDRAFDVGIAEQHAVTFAAGLAAQGKKAFCAIYSTFLQRGFDQLVHDVAIQKLPVVFCIDRAGVVGADGPTHHGAYDISYLRAIPNLIISSPLNEQDLRDMMFTASEYDEAAWAIRYPRGASTGMNVREHFESMPIGKGKKIKDGEVVAIATFGPIGKYAIEVCEAYAAEGIHIAHYDMRYAKPLDIQLLNEIALKFDHVITLEDAAVVGGFGSAVAEYYATLDMDSIADTSAREHKNNPPRLHIMGLPDRIIEHGTQRELHDEVGIGPDGLTEKIASILAHQKVSEFSA